MSSGGPWVRHIYTRLCNNKYKSTFVPGLSNESHDITLLIYIPRGVVIIVIFICSFNTPFGDDRFPGAHSILVTLPERYCTVPRIDRVLSMGFNMVCSATACLHTVINHVYICI